VSADARVDGRWSAADSVGGLLATISIFASVFGAAWRPVRILPFAILLALVASRMSARHERLVGVAIAVSVAAWVIGLTIAVVTKNPLY